MGYLWSQFSREEVEECFYLSLFQFEGFTAYHRQYIRFIGFLRSHFRFVKLFLLEKGDIQECQYKNYFHAKGCKTFKKWKILLLFLVSEVSMNKNQKSQRITLLFLLLFSLAWILFNPSSHYRHRSHVI